MTLFVDLAALAGASVEDAGRFYQGNRTRRQYRGDERRNG